MKNITLLKNKLKSMFSEKTLINGFIKYRKKIYFITLLGIFMFLLYRLTFLPYFNIIFNPSVIFYSIIFIALLVLQFRPGTLIKLAIFLFAFLVVPSLFNLHTIVESIGNIIFVFLFAAAILYIWQIREEKK